MSGWQDSNLRPPRPKRGAMTGLRYTPKMIAHLRTANIEYYLYIVSTFFKINLKEMNLKRTLFTVLITASIITNAQQKREKNYEVVVSDLNIPWGFTC